MWSIFDTHGDPCFRSEKKDFKSFKEMVDYINNDDELLDRLEHNWACVYPNDFDSYLLLRTIKAFYAKN